MKDLSPQQVRKLQKLAKVMDEGNVAVLEHLFELEDSIDAKVEKLTSSIPDVPKLLESIRGKDGERGEQGPQGEPGRDGVDGRDGKDGKQGPKGDTGAPGRDGKDGRDGVDGKDGADGFVDESTIAYLEDKIDTIEEELKKKVKDEGTKWWGGVGAIKGLRAGDNITIDDSNIQYPIITASLPAGSGIARSIVSTSGNVTMGATGSTDYVYIVTGAHTVTLPTAVANTNLYTVRNNHTANITVNTTASQNISGAVTATTYSIWPGDARDFISDGTGWHIV